MTTEQIAYLNYEETQRANKAKEQLNERYYDLESDKSRSDIALKEQQRAESQSRAILANEQANSQQLHREQTIAETEATLLKTGDAGTYFDRIADTYAEQGLGAAILTGVTSLPSLLGGLLTPITKRLGG